MISKIKIENFKSLEKMDLSISNLNVLTGVNGMGKSTVIQVLLLLRQSLSITNAFSQGLYLKGYLTGNLGTFNDVLYKNAKNDKIIFAIEDSGEEIICECDKGPFAEVLRTSLPMNIGSFFLNKALFSYDKFQYISAGRITPQNSFSKSDEALANKNFGTNGEYSVQYLFERGTDEAIIADLRDSHSNNPLPLINQVDYWLKNVSPNVSVDIKLKSNSEYELRYKYPNKDQGFNSFSAANSAFGLTFALPIITALLASNVGDLLILENPENDLHPKAQSMIGQLIARVAALGVQIIVETHSDHIINGICLAIHQEKLKSDLARVYFFNRSTTETSSIVYEVKIRPNGHLDDSILIENGIEGFNDQIGKDLKQIIFNE